MTTRASKRKQSGPEPPPVLTADAWLDARIAETERDMKDLQQRVTNDQRSILQLQGALAAYKHSRAVMTPQETRNGR